MRKSKIYNSSKIKTRRNKKNKRKHILKSYRGGYVGDDIVTFVGFWSPMPGGLSGWSENIPLFLFNDTEVFKRGDPYSIYKFSPDHYNRKYSHIILPQMYKLKKLRGLNLYTTLQNNFTFYDENGNALIGRNFVPAEGQRWDIHWQSRPSKDKPMYKDTIREVELKYPGLFQRIYVTEAEENEALREIERKEQEKQATVAEVPGLTEEEREYNEGIEQIKYFNRGEIKNKKNKKTRKIRDTGVTIGNNYY